jgi:hydrogenase 3 maturation protease
MLPERQFRHSEAEVQLARFLEGRVCLLGIGNRYRRDDGVGSQIAKSLGAHPDIDTVDAGFVPENHLETVAQLKPDSILLIDAADFGGAPGELRLIQPNEVAFSGISTHAGSLQMLAEYLEARTKARVALLAIQPSDIDSGEDLSPGVFAAAKALQEMLPELCRLSRLAR